MALHTYLPQDRWRALVRGEALPDRTAGAALLADVSGFTALTEVLASRLGERRGIEELSLRINAVYDSLIGEVERFAGSVICFSGDAITCWFDARDPDASRRAVLCAQAMQLGMQRFPDLSVKVGVSTGPARRFAVGQPGIQLIDVVAGATVARVSTAESLAQAGEILVDQATATLLQAAVRESRVAPTGETFFVLDPPPAGDERERNPGRSAAGPGTAPPEPALLRPWVLPFVRDREIAGEGLFLTDLRPTVALFLRFVGLDYDNDAQAADELGTLVSKTQFFVQRHGGVMLELTIGDKGSYFYASFGAAQVHEDDARRALRSALELREFFSALPYPAQIGLSSGTMRVGGYGSSTRQSFGAMGDDVNLAARLMMTALPGEILISGRVRKAIASEFTLEARPPISFKGKTEPLPVFAVLGAHQQRAIRLQEPAYALPMIGRDIQLTLLAERLAATLQGRGQIVGVTAEAGMGKSRLVAEGIRLARRSRLIGYGGTCQLDGIGTPYLVWQPIWNAFFDLDPALPLRKQIRSIAAELEDRVPEHLDALPLLGPALGMELPDNDFTRALEPQDRKALLETVLLGCLESAAREAAEDGGGLLLVLEDLHWADPLSLDLLELAARMIEDLPVLILLTYRPADAAAVQPVGARLGALRQFGQVTLGGLNASDTELAIRAKLAHLFPERLGAVPPALIERIDSRAQGNPFYVEELLNYLHDRGIDPRTLAALDALDLPASLHSLVLSRIDELRVSQQLALKVASIIGRAFRFDDLHACHPWPGGPGALKGDLQELDRLDFTPLSTPEPELSYLFKHLVTLEVGYESIAHATRVQLHGQYARYLEARYPDRAGALAPQLAHHFAKAGIEDRACFYLTRAGEQAAASFANDEALDYFARALDMVPSDDTHARFELLLSRERVYHLQGRHAGRRQDLAELEQLATHFDDPAMRRAQVALRRSRLEFDVGDYPAARSSARAAIQAIGSDAAADTPQAGLLVDALLLEAHAMLFAGEAAAARPQLEHALALARRLQYLHGEYSALSQLGALHWHAADYETAEGLLERSLQLVRQAGDARREIDLLNNLGVVAKARSRFSAAIGHYGQAQVIARKIGDRSGVATLFNNMGSASLASGDFVQAGLYSEQAATIFGEIERPTHRGMALVNRAEAHRELGQYALALDSAGLALALLRSSGYRLGEAIVLDNIGMVEHALGHLEQALQSTASALNVAREIGSRSTEASALLHLGMIHTATGRFDEARQALDDARTLARELGEELRVLEVEVASAELALARGGPAGPVQAFAGLTGLIPELLQQPGDAQPRFLSLWLYLVGYRVLAACGDARAAPLIERARALLNERSDKIADPAVRRDYLGVAEHRAIAAA